MQPDSGLLPLLHHPPVSGRANRRKPGILSPQLYMALAMLAELTDGNSRQQVLDLLDVPDLETLRTGPRPCGSPTM